MSCTYQIDPAQRLAHLTARGRVDVGEMTRTAIAMIEDPAFEPGTDQLVDLSAVTGSDGVFRNLRALASRGPDFRHRLEGGRPAIVAPGDLVFGLARLYLAAGNELPVEARVFREAHAAHRWLGIEAEPHPETSARQRRGRAGPSRVGTRSGMLSRSGNARGREPCRSIRPPKPSSPSSRRPTRRP